ncbi:unnamed protein product, partial [Notodromas monacha]
MFNSSDSRGLAASKSQARHSVRSTALSNNARAANNSRCAATSWIECAAASVNDDEVQSWSRAIVDQVKRMDGLKDGDLMDNGLTQKFTDSMTSMLRSRGGMAKKTKLPPCPRNPCEDKEPPPRSILG